MARVTESLNPGWSLLTEGLFHKIECAVSELGDDQPWPFCTAMRSLGRVRKGDTLVVIRIDRLVRSLAHRPAA
jgi:hypothetical protein